MNRILATFAAAVALASVSLVGAPARAADQLPTDVQHFTEVAGGVVHLGIGKSMVIDLDEDVRDVLVSSPTVADAVVRSARRVFLMGMGAGETNVFLFGEGGKQIGQFELVVSRDTVGLEQLFAEVIPGSNIAARTIGDSLVLTGTAPTSETAGKASELAAKYVGSPDKVVNMLTVAGTDQVHLKVVVAEVQREVLKDLGIDTQTLLENTGIGLSVVGAKSLAPAGDWAARLTSSASFGSSLGSVLKLLHERNVVRTLAEPTLTAISGEQANFLAGGEYPIPVAADNDTITVEYKKFGVQLAFRPVVLTPGRISLKVMTEVSELSDVGAIQANGLRLPSLTVRRAESTVELPSGGSIVLAGLIRDNVRQTVTGYPGLMDVPVLGALFKSREFQRNQTELAVFVSPYLVKEMAAGEMTRPDAGLAFVGDSQAMFLNKVNKVYRPGAEPAAGSYHGTIGFAFE